jgi:hypothetical protein
MNDEDLTGPSRVGWQWLGLLVLVALLVGFAIIPYLEARGELQAYADPARPSVTIEHDGYSCTTEDGKPIAPAVGSWPKGSTVYILPAKAVCR